MKKKFTVMVFVFLIGCSVSSERMKADDLYGRGEYRKALRSYEAAYIESTTEGQRTEIQAKINMTRKKIVDDVLERADAAYKKTDPPSVQSINGVISILQNSATDDASERISTRIKKYRTEKKNLILDKAEKMREHGAYAAAIKAFQEALEMDPDNQQLVEQISRLKTVMEREKQTGIAAIDKALHAGEVDKAKAQYDKLASMDPEDPHLESLKKRINEVRRKSISASALDYESQGKFFTAYKTLKDADVGGLNQEMLRIRTEGRTHYLNKAEKFFDKGQIHLAYIASVKGLTLAPDDIRISQIHKKCEDLIDKELQRNIVIMTFGAPAKQPDTGMLFSDALITRLFNELPYGINIVEKGKIDLLKNKSDIKSIGTSLGADIVITGNVSLFKVEDVVSENMAAAKIKIGEEVVVNPEYEEMIKTYGKDRKKWPYKPEMKVKKDNYEIVNYKKGIYSKQAFGNVSVRMFDASNGTVVSAKNFEDSLEKTDQFQEMVEGTDIQYDPLELPSDTELKADLRNRLVDAISNTIVDILEEREKRLLRWAVLHMERNEYMKAIKFLAQGYLFCDKSNTNNEYSKKIYNMMTALTEID